MKTVMQIIMKDQTVLQVEAVVKKTIDTFLKVHEQLEGTTPLFLEIEHTQLNTLLELTKVTPYTLLYFEENLIIKGAAFSLNGSQSSFSINTQAKKILFLHYPIDFKPEDVTHLNIDS